MAETQPMMLQALCYTATDFRNQMASLVCGQGVSDLSGGSLLVTTDGSGLDLSVAEGGAFVDSDVDDEGMYWIFNDAAATVTATAADGSNPRIDQVIATVKDAQISGADNEWELSVLAGTATGGATLANLTGAAALPDRSIRLAYVLVPTSFAGPFVNATHILDARETYEACGGEPYVELEPSGATSIPNTGVFTQPNMVTVVHIDRAHYSVSGSTITVLQAGLYSIEAADAVAGDSAGTRRSELIVNNTNLPNASPDGTIIDGQDMAAFSASIAAKLRARRLGISLAVNDTIKFALAVSSAGGALNSNSGTSAHLTVRKVG